MVSTFLFFFLAQKSSPWILEPLTIHLLSLDLLIPFCDSRINIDFPDTQEGPLANYKYAEDIKYWGKMGITFTTAGIDGQWPLMSKL